MKGKVACNIFIVCKKFCKKNCNWTETYVFKILKQEAKQTEASKYWKKILALLLISY